MTALTKMSWFRRRGRLAVVLLVAPGVVACERTGTQPAPSTPPPAWFVDVTTQVGLDFVHESGGTGEYYTPEVTGSGCALLDVDGDGDLDVYFINATWFDDGASTPVNRLFVQESDGRFVDATDASGLGDPGYGMGVAAGDIENDGDVDVYVTNMGLDRLFRNRGDGTFEDATHTAGIDVPGWSCSAAFFDFNRDGYLDLYITQYLEFDDRRVCFDATGRRDYCAPAEFRPVPDVLLQNNGDGTFTDISEQAGMSTVAAPGLGVVCEDLNDDGWIDIYVANDAFPNNLWINNGDGTFRDDAVILGAAYNMHGLPEASMGLVAADLDNSGTLDLFMTHFAEETNTLYRNLGDGVGFIDATGTSGLGEGNMSYTGFGTVAVDLERDGDLDLCVVNGATLRRARIDGTSMTPPWDEYAEPNLLYLNEGAGLFTLHSEYAGALASQIEISRGLATGDIDGDGDLDMLVSNVQGPGRLYRNDAPRNGHWLRVRCVEPGSGRDSLGARVDVVAGQQRWVRTINTAISYLTVGEAVADVGLGNVRTVDRIEVRWPDGSRERFSVDGVDATLVLERGTGESL